jgi:hypothetical protein
MSTQRKRNGFLNAKPDGISYRLKLKAKSQHAAAYRRTEKAMEARCENCGTGLR